MAGSGVPMSLSEACFDVVNDTSVENAGVQSLYNCATELSNSRMLLYQWLESESEREPKFGRIGRTCSVLFKRKLARCDSLMFQSNFTRMSLISVLRLEGGLKVPALNFHTSLAIAATSAICACVMPVTMFEAPEPAGPKLGACASRSNFS